MNWEEYTDKTKETAVYPGTDARVHANTNTKAITYLGLGIAGETGEVVDVIKKQIRKEGSWGDPEFMENMIEEIGDVFWYSAQLMDRLGITFDEVVAFNIDKLAGRKAKGTLKERAPKFNEAPDVGPTYNNGGIVEGKGPIHAVVQADGYVVAAKDVLNRFGYETYPNPIPCGVAGHHHVNGFSCKKPS